VTSLLTKVLIGKLFAVSVSQKCWGYKVIILGELHVKVVIVTVALRLGVICLVGVLVGEPISISIGFDAVKFLLKLGRGA